MEISRSVPETNELYQCHVHSGTGQLDLSYPGSCDWSVPRSPSSSVSRTPSPLRQTLDSSTRAPMVGCSGSAGDTRGDLTGSNNQSRSTCFASASPPYELIGQLSRTSDSSTSTHSLHSFRCSFNDGCSRSAASPSSLCASPPVWGAKAFQVLRISSLASFGCKTHLNLLTTRCLECHIGSMEDLSQKPHLRCRYIVAVHPLDTDPDLKRQQLSGSDIVTIASAGKHVIGRSKAKVVLVT